MEIFLALAGVAIIPIVITILFPKHQEYFEKAVVRGFGLGVYLMLVIILLKEAIELGGAMKSLSWFGIGLLVSFIIGLVLKEFHHHHSPEEKEHRHNKSSMYRILMSDFFHNIVDGIAIIAGFSLDTSVGLIAFAGVLGHQIIQQAGQQILLVESGAKPRRAIMLSFVIALSIFIGYLINEGSSLEMIFIALSAGIVSWKVVVDIMHTKWTRKLVLGFALGAFILAAILLLVPHTHEHEDGHGHEDESHIEEHEDEHHDEELEGHEHEDDHIEH